jgi:hypothetical protein
MGRGLADLFGYGETELDPAVQSEILFETARAEARLAIWALLVTIGVGLWFKFQGYEFRGAVIVAILTVFPFLVDSAIRRKAADRLRGVGPQPPPRGPPPKK